MSVVDVRRRSPLAHCAPVEAGDGSYRVEERPSEAKFVLRVDPEEAASGIITHLGCSLPSATQAREVNGVRVLWMGPDEFLVVGDPGTDSSLEQKLSQSVEGLHAQIADVGDYYTAISVSGPFAREALGRLSTLDLHPRGFPVGTVAGSMFAKANAVLHLRNGPAGEVFDLYVRWSMAAYLWSVLLESGRSKGLRAPPGMAVDWSINPEG